MSRALTIPEPLKQRQARASDPKTSAWVSANAGSGKTHVLTQRVLRLLLSGTPPAQILCLAYTKAAAANMADRVFSKLALWTSLSDNALVKAIVDCGADAPGPHDLIFARQLFARTIETPGGLKISDAARLCRKAAAAFSFRGQRPGPFQGSRRARIEAAADRGARHGAGRAQRLKRERGRAGPGRARIGRSQI